MAKLTHMQETFCLEYIIDFHATNAALRAGCKPKSAASTASQWLTMPKIQAKLTELQAETSKISGISAKRLLQEIARVAFFDPKDMYNSEGQLKKVSEMPPHVRAMVAGVEEIEMPGGVGLLKKVKLWEKPKAFEQLMKHLGLYELDNNQKKPITEIIIDFTDEDENAGEQKGAETVDPDPNAGATGPDFED